MIVDTSVWIEFLRGRTYPDLELALKEGRVILSPLVIAELMSGVGSKRETTRLEQFLLEIPCHETPPEHWVKVGQLRGRLAKQGFQTSIPDAHIAQCALDLECSLFSLDKIFAKIAEAVGLRLALET